jgi:hypothetical protein
MSINNWENNLSNIHKFSMKEIFIKISGAQFSAPCINPISRFKKIREKTLR